MQFATRGGRQSPAILFFHAMGVAGASSEPVARYLQQNYYCILPTSSVYCAGQKYSSKADELRQIEDFLHGQRIDRLALVVASSIGGRPGGGISGADPAADGAARKIVKSANGCCILPRGAVQWRQESDYL